MRDLEELVKNLGEIKRDFSLRELTTLRIGGKARYFFIPYSEFNLVEALRIFREKGLDYYILGGGSNILISSEGIEKVIIKLNFQDKCFLKKDSIFYLGSSLTIREILNFSLINNLGGLEFLASLPASLGGAIVNNASFRGDSIFDRVRRVKVLDPQTQKIFFLDKERIEYGYRCSSLKSKGLIVLGAEIGFYPSSSENIKEKIAQVVAYRIRTQEVGKYSAGCIFKNPSSGVSSAKLIEEVGLKGFRRGSAFISLKHANFIINEGEASSWDVIFLIEYIKEKVYNKFGILLEEEIEKWGC